VKWYFVALTFGNTCASIPVESNSEIARLSTGSPVKREEW
jgi:hypothetical protein